MSWQTEYHFNFISLDGKNNLVEFLIDSATTVTDTEITGAANPFVVELPSLDSIFQVVRGTGATIQLLSETDMQFFDSLYTSDPFGIMIRHSVDGVLNWLGYVNSEMMQEPYSFSSNYPIQILANNGLSLLTRLSLLQSDQSYYTGLKSEYDILKICLDKIGLPWTTINISSATTFTGQSSSASSTILHESYLNSANFYTEDPAPMTLREVIETILEPYGAFIWADADGIYITDVDTFAAGTSIAFKQFNYSTGVYIQDVVVSNNQAVSSIGYMGTGQNIENSGGVNKQVIDYSPYPTTNISGTSIANESEFGTIPATYSTKNGYNYRTLGNNSIWKELSPATFEESYYNNGVPNIYLQWPLQSTDQQLMSFKTPPIVNLFENQVGFTRNTYDVILIRVKYKVLIKTKTNPYDDTTTGPEFEQAEISARMKVGNVYYGGVHGWTTTDYGLGAIYVSNSSGIANKFVDGTTDFMVFANSAAEQQLLYGGLDFQIWSDVWANNDINSASLTQNPSSIQEIWVSNVGISIVMGDGSEISNTDKEYIGLLDPNFQNEGKKVTLKSGTSVSLADKAMLIYVDSNGYYQPIKTWTRSSQTDKIENLLLNSYVSNFKAGTNKITNLVLKNNASIWRAITDSNRSGRVFMVKSAKVDYWDNKIECDIAEVKQDELTITSI